MTTPPRALHLPDLPEVSVQIGDGSIDGPEVAPTGIPAARPRPALSYRLQQALASYLPLLLMGLLALMTAWLVQHTPTPDGPTAPRAVREAADYTMTGFAIQRFGPDGREILRIAGDRLRHFPLSDQLEIEGVRVHAVAPDGRLTDAVARRALVIGDGSEVQLLGGAQVVSQLGAGEALEVKGEFLHAFVRLGRLRSQQPVLVRRGASVTQAGGLDYDHHERQLTLLGPVRVTVPASARGATQP
jgi:lipopolysaccharide export system protein LptC